jgi:hypothetical protein
MPELSKITDKLLKHGFTPIEIPGLLDDITHLFKESKNCTTNSINQELENLGWGIQILDESLFEEIASLMVT